MKTPKFLAPLLGSAVLPLVTCRNYSPVIPCSDLKAPNVEGADLVGITAKEINSGGVDVCDVDVYLTHGKAGDNVRIQTYLPLRGYTGRFQGVGGAGMIAGFFDENLSAAASSGFAAGSTDAGRPNVTQTDDSWSGNEQLTINFAYLSVHEMTVVGRGLAEQFYGQPVEYSYWNGCSNGGRQGYVAAQRYPNDYDGIMANAPGINWDRFLVADLWGITYNIFHFGGYVVEVAENEFPSSCVWDFIKAAAIKACDKLDGGEDNIINMPFKCHFDAKSTIGQKACNATITHTQARIWNDIIDGPRDDKGNNVWGGLLPGTDISILGGSSPFEIGAIWVASFVEKNRQFDVSTIPKNELYAEMRKSESMYRSVMGGDNPDLSDFRDAGGKLITFHGLVDQILPVFGTVNYRQRVEKLLGGNEAVNEFYRLFLAPGVDHCALGVGGIGAQPSDPFSQLVNWVENGVAPEVMPAKSGIGERNLCPFPKDLVYTGKGNLTQASSWTCK
ncbi:feruloyl esterase B [Hypomontagnella monticulosa]|nr:feruloyl esterase B [Hypomontagnella monticulosa]